MSSLVFCENIYLFIFFKCHMHCCQCKSGDCLHCPPSNSQLSVPVNQPASFFAYCFILAVDSLPDVPSNVPTMWPCVLICHTSAWLSSRPRALHCRFWSVSVPTCFSLLLPELMDYLDSTLDRSNDCVVPFALPPLQELEALAAIHTLVNTNILIVVYCFSP